MFGTYKCRYTMGQLMKYVQTCILLSLHELRINDIILDTLRLVASIKHNVSLNFSDFKCNISMLQTTGLLFCLFCYVASWNSDWTNETTVMQKDICARVHNYYESHSCCAYCKLDRRCTGDGPCCVSGYNTFGEESVKIDTDRY